MNKLSFSRCLIIAFSYLLLSFPLFVQAGGDGDGDGIIPCSSTCYCNCVLVCKDDSGRIYNSSDYNKTFGTLDVNGSNDGIGGGCQPNDRNDIKRLCTERKQSQCDELARSVSEKKGFWNCTSHFSKDAFCK